MSSVYLKKGSIGNVNELKAKKAVLMERFKFPLLVRALGIILMLIPGSGDNTPVLSQSDALVSEMLSQVQGVGEAVVLISDKGVVVVCSGADNAKTRMEIIQAVGSYTGYGSDKITILKMVD